MTTGTDTPSTGPSTDHTPSTAEGELYDALVIGGGPAGLSAAVALGRSLRRVLIIDAGAPRNRFASHMHTVLGHEGIDPAELLRRGRQEALSYGADLVTGRVSRLAESTGEAGPTSLVATLEDGRTVFGRVVIAAGGLSDDLPEIPGLAERWGRSVLHCPYCHGWEVRGQRIGVLATSPLALHHAELLRQWTDRLTFFSAGAGELPEETAARLRSRGVTIETVEVAAVEGQGSALSSVALADGRHVPVDALFTLGALRPHDEFLAGFELERAPSPMGDVLTVDATGRTSHPRIWAAGNLASPGANVVVAMSAGTMAGAGANMALVSEDFDAAQQRAQQRAPQTPQQPPQQEEDRHDLAPRSCASRA
ncbi:NAD(P)/FAD-dependent oxidoreductase [Nesterenkonia suensis]